ncbi:12151_t:CDS:1, partial [Ambispora leptoticha]
DIVSITGKFVIENSEQYITIASATKVDKKDSSDEFNLELIPLNTPHLMFNTTVICDLNTMGETIHFGVETKEYNSCTGNRDIYMPITVFYPIQHTRFNHLRANLKIGKPLMISGFLHIIKSTTIMVEATDIDYLRQEINYN